IHAAHLSGGGMVRPVSSTRTPLWPAGHLPLKGGDHLTYRPSPVACDWRERSPLSISPLEGEMAGRPEGAAIAEARQRAWLAAAAVPDPEIPCVTVADLGIL